MDNLFGGQEQLASAMDTIWDMVLTYTPKLLLAIVTLLIGLWLINRLVNMVEKKLLQKDPTLGKFLGGLISAILKILLVISVAGMVGVETTSFIAALGAAGLAVGLALQGSLANFAGGVLILIFKPFRAGDVIEAQGYVGTVAEIQILYTIVNTFDNKRVVIPNGNLSNASLINYSAYETRRVDMEFGIAYSDDIQKAKRVIRDVIEADERVLKDPEVMVMVGSLGDNSVNIMARAWANAPDVWPVFWAMQEKVKEAFDAEGISIPFPQRDVHLYQQQG
ncbi:mechanosensitive ion channel [Marinobacteraceae bacterium S3BR75-40.1]